MSGNEVNYAAFTTFLGEVSEAASKDAETTQANIAAFVTTSRVIGSSGTSSALRFRARNGLAGRSMAYFMADQLIGRIALANAAACCAVAYYNGDINQQGTLDGIFNPPPGDPDSVRGPVTPPGAEPPPSQNDGPGTYDTNGDGVPDAVHLPDATTDSSGNLVDRNSGQVIMYASGKPGPAYNESAGTGGNQAYLTYLNRINQANATYYSIYTNKTPEEIMQNPSQHNSAPVDPDQEEKDPVVDAYGNAYAEQVGYTEEAQAQGPAPAPVPELPEDEPAPNVSVYQPPAS